MDTPPRLTLEQVEGDPALRSRDTSGVGAIAIGTVAWIIALILVIALGASWGIDVDRWMLVCAIGAGLGIPGMALVLSHRSRERHRSPQD
ncbi:MAG: DUF2530 domain-containing protein [Candidatus Nanopelagicales bacterium]|nr:DUF2530 domain-containing protein [Candidatus Nanopelagicales bacterium]MDP4974536.1 DUF2530 domain-containing protein [Candidatus Nanopelagicales bacterium]